jgi:hypothetical protein
LRYICRPSGKEEKIFGFWQISFLIITAGNTINLSGVYILPP